MSIEASRVDILAALSGTDLQTPDGPAAATLSGAAPALLRRSGAFIGAVNLITQAADRLLAFGQIVLIAAVFGVSLDADRYFLAGVVPLTIGYVVGDLVSRAFMTLVSEDPARAKQLAASGLVICAAVLAALSAAYVAAAALIVQLVTPTGSADLAIWLAFVPIPLGLGLSAFLGAVLLWREHYVWSAARLPVATAIGLALAAAAALADKGVVWFGLATSAGYVLTAVVLYLRVAGDLGVRWPARVDRQALGQAWGVRRKLVAPAIGSVIGGQVLVLVERALASPLGIGSVAAIAYARGIATAPTAVSQALGAAVYPALVRGNAAASPAYIRDLVGRGLRLAILFGTGIGAYLALFGTDVIAFLLQRGAFDAASAERAGSLLEIFGLAAFAASLVFFLVPVLYGLDHFGAILVLESAIFLPYLALAFPLRAAFGLEGLAAAFALALAVGAAVAIGMVARRTALSPQVILSDVLIPIVPMAAAVTGALGIYRLVVDVVDVRIGLDGVVRIGGSAAVLVLAIGLALLASPKPEGARLRSLLRGGRLRSM